MELVICLTSLLLLLPLLLFITKRSSKRLPPGSMGIPIVGQSLNLLQAMRANKGEQWIQERIKKYGPISKLNVFGTPTVLLHGQAANKFIYTCDSNILANKQPESIRRLCGERNILELSGEDHQRVRAALVLFLKPEVLKQYVGKMDEEIRMHLQMHWHGKHQVQVEPLMKTLTFNIICSLIFGIERGIRREVLVQLFKSLIEGVLSVPINLPFTRFNHSLQSSAKAKAIIMDLIREKRVALEEQRASTQQDLITRNQFPSEIDCFDMESFNQTTGFRYNPDANTEGDSEFSGILEIFVHHARNIHNICIYDNQDVYAKFSLTYNPDETFSTRIINGGGKNPEFNENLIMKVSQFDAVLKCEIWILSRAKNFMEDQLLGFALVPISSVVGKGKMTQDFSLSSTDLFHSPAVEYSRIEFPDISIVKENQKMVSEYFDLGSHGSGSKPGLVGPGLFLHLGASHQALDDYEMAANSTDETRAGSDSPNGSIQNSGFMSSTMTSLSDDRNSADSLEKKNHLSETTHSPSACPETPTSKKGSDPRESKEPNFSEENTKEGNLESSKFGEVFSAPLGNINLEGGEQAAMQQQIVDMYMRSMQQFTESLAKMKLPMDLDKPEAEDRGDLIQNHDSNVKIEKKKDCSRVFYGSRAFF